ncbi:unnamed protein product [Caenorhabditis sp. 36 PRJEB53466]|nr:unnamed protein product [Caenorhabditis sp. 36 PRJEB53466]
MLIPWPVIREEPKSIVPPKSRDVRAEQIRMFALNQIVKQNSHILPPRSKNISAQEMCRKKYTCPPQLRRYETMLRVSPKYKMVNCVVQKSMSTMMTGAMCYLYDEQKFERSGIAKYCKIRFCKGNNEFSSVNGVRDVYNISLFKTDWSFSMITRNPIDRFVSGYVDRCVRILQPNATEQCNGCGLNMTCFIEKEYKHLMDISFRRKTHRTMEDAHFFPQIWHCDLNDEFEFFEFIPYSTDPETELMPHFEDLLKRQKVPRSSIEFIRNEFATRKPNHATTGTPAQRFYYSRLTNSPYLLEFIVKMFYFDFVQFHYEFPPGF